MLTFILKQKQKNRNLWARLTFSQGPKFIPIFFKNQTSNLHFSLQMHLSLLRHSPGILLPFQLISLSPVSSSAGHLLQEDLSHGCTVVFTNQTTNSGCQGTADTRLLKCTTFHVWTGLVAPNQYSGLPENHSDIAR